VRSGTALESHLGLDGVEHDEVRRFADCETVIGEADHLGRAAGHHVKAFSHVGLPADLTDIRIEARHPDERME
jgi:hypothetical protein